MAISFDESDDYFSIADHASLTLPDGDWCVAVWIYVSDNSGADYQYLLSNNGYEANNSFNLLLVEEDNAGANDDKWILSVEDGDGTNPGDIVSASTPGGDSTWRLIVCQRDDSENEIQLWFCEPGQSAVKEGAVADTDFAAVNGGDWNIGRRVDGDADRYYGSIACEFSKGDFALTQSEIEALAAGVPIYALGHTPDVYLPMTESVATLCDLFGGNDATRSSAPTTAEHAPVGLTLGPICVQAVAVAGIAGPLVGRVPVASLVHGGLV